MANLYYKCCGEPDGSRYPTKFPTERPTFHPTRPILDVQPGNTIAGGAGSDNDFKAPANYFFCGVIGTKSTDTQYPQLRFLFYTCQPIQIHSKNSP